MSEPASDNPASAQAAAAARKARRKKTRWGADKETPHENEAQAGSTEIPTVAQPGSVITANVPPQQEIASLKLNSVPSGTPGQPASTSAFGQTVSASLSANIQPAAAGTVAYPWSKGAASTPAAGDAQTTANEVLPGPPPKPGAQPNAQQPWLPGAPQATGPNGIGSAPPAAHFPPYAPEHYYQYPAPAGFAMPGMQAPAAAMPTPADDDRPPGVEDTDDAAPGAESEQAPVLAVASDPNAHASTGATAAPAGTATELPLPGPPAAAVHHPHDATAPPSFPASYPPADVPYPQPYPHVHYPQQYIMPLPDAADESEPGPPGAEDEPQAPGTEGDNPATAYGYGEGYADPAYAYQAGYGMYTDPQTGYTYPYDPQQAYGYDPNYYGYAGYGQYPGAEGAAEAASEAPAAPSGEPGPPTGSPTKAAADGKPKITPPVVQVKLPKQYYEKLQAKKREEEERAKQDLLRKTAEADARRQEAANAAAARARLAEEMANGHEQEEVQLKDLEPEDQLLAASTPAEVRAAKKAMAAKEAAKAKAAAEQAAAAMPKQPLHELQEKEPAHKERKRRTKSRWRDDDQEAEVEMKASKRRRASPQVFDRSKIPHPSSPSLSPLRGPPPPRRMSPRRRGPPMREPSPERPKQRRPRGYRSRRSLSVERLDTVQRYSPQPVQEYEPQPAPKPEPTEEEKAAEAQAAVAARDTTPEVSEEGEIPVDPEELEVISKAQEKPAAKPAPHRSPVRQQLPDREHDRLHDRDRGTPRGRDKPAGGRGFGNERKRGRGRGNQQPNRAMDHRDSRNSYDRQSGGREGYMARPPPGLMQPVYAQYAQQEQQYADGEYEEYEETSAYDSSVYQPASYDAPYGVYGSAVGSAMVGRVPYGQYGSYN